MNCQEALQALDDDLDGDLEEAAFQEMELHLGTCPACREQENLQKALLAQARALAKELSPSRDLWAGIESRLEPRRGRGLPWWSPTVLATAAAVLLCLTPSLRRNSPRFSGKVSQAGYAGEAPQILEAEKEYDLAARELSAALASRSHDLSPETLAAVERELRTIDQALVSLRTALGNDPENASLTHLLASTHRRKLDVLRRASHLQAEL